MSAKKEQEAAPVPESRFPLALPAASDVAESVPTTEVNSAFKLHDLGPVVVNENGSISRIDNWHEMSDIEKANVNRILLKRNKERLEKLRKECEANEQA
ncbi:hypothetical protein Unana1_02003 [Umbelopsis nana]